jgi:hypothetical protein
VTEWDGLKKGENGDVEQVLEGYNCMSCRANGWDELWLDGMWSCDTAELGKRDGELEVLNFSRRFQCSE